MNTPESPLGVRVDQPWKHDALAADVARWLKTGGETWCWLNSTIGEWSGPRPDVMSYRRFRYHQPVIRAFEAKISRSDLLADLRAEKWRSYLEHCVSVTFVMPSGLCSKSEIPAECGVMFRSARGWRTERRPTDIGNPASMLAMAKLLTMHPMVIPTEKTTWQTKEIRDRATRAFNRAIGEKFSRKTAQYLALVAEGKDPVDRAREQAAEILSGARSEAELIRSKLKPIFAALGVPENTSDWGLLAAITERTRLLDADGQLQAVRAHLADVRRSLDRAELAVAPAKSEAA